VEKIATPMLMAFPMDPTSGEESSVEQTL